jgi:hypothetical protein
MGSGITSQSLQVVRYMRRQPKKPAPWRQSKFLCSFSACLFARCEMMLLDGLVYFDESLPVTLHRGFTESSKVCAVFSSVISSTRHWG